VNLTELQHALRQLRLGGIATVLETRLHQAQAEAMAPIDLIACLFHNLKVRLSSMPYLIVRDMAYGMCRQVQVRRATQDALPSPVTLPDETGVGNGSTGWLNSTRGNRCSRRRSAGNSTNFAVTVPTRIEPA
jgi:hypothetical protein